MNTQIKNDNFDFLDLVAPTFGGVKIPIPPPKLEAMQRLQRRMSFRNERHLFKQTCQATNKQILSVYHPDDNFVVYDQDAWWGDSWNPLSYGRDFDFSRTLTEQLRELYQVVPHMSLRTQNVENCYYSNYNLDSRNCYLVFGCANSEDCMYGHYVIGGTDCLDCFSTYDCELCYEGISSIGCYNCQWFNYSRNCTDCMFIECCESCSNCILCFGLHRAEYCIMNKQYSKEEYEKHKATLFPLKQETIDQLIKNLIKLRDESPKHSHIYASDNCSGNMIFNSKNCFDCFDIKECEDCRYLGFCPKGYHAYDCTFAAPHGLRYCYNVCSCTGTSEGMSSFLCWLCDRAYYSIECHNSKNIIACASLKKHENCILNKEYSTHEWEKLALKIAHHLQDTGEWGEFLDPSLSAYPYNHTLAHEEFPLSKEQVISGGWRWREDIKHRSKPSNDILICSDTQKAFKVLPKEVQFYQKLNLPVPGRHPDRRHTLRLLRR